MSAPEAIIAALALAVLLLAYVVALLVWDRIRLSKPLPPIPNIPTAEPADETNEPWEEDPDAWKEK